jgi:hypothetical protein
MRYLTSKSFKIINPFKAKNFELLEVAFISCKTSVINFLFQTMNGVLILLLLTTFLPQRIDDYLSQWNQIQVFYSHLPKLGISVFLFFLTYILTLCTNLKWTMIFRTRLAHSMSLLFTLVVSIVLLYYKTFYSIGKKIYLTYAK